MPNRLQAPSPWLVALLPWVIDLLFKTSFLNTLWGALLWGLLIVTYFAQARLIDPTLKRYLNILLLCLACLWVAGWVRSFLTPVENPLRPSDSLYFLHATFLVAAIGMLFILFAASSAGAIKERKMFSATKSAGRAPQRKTPSLEGLLKLCSWSFGLGRIFWLLGCLLALLALAVQAVHTANRQGVISDGIMRWSRDPAMWAVWFMALMFLFSGMWRARGKSNTLFSGYFFMSFFSLLIALAIVWVESHQAGHIGREFLR